MAKRAFIDANVWFAAAYSPKGGSGELLERAAREEIFACANQHVLDEALRNLLLKAEDCVESYLSLLSKVGPTMVTVSIPINLQDKLESLVPDKDIPVLAGSILGNVAYLVTLDRKDLMNETVRTHAWLFDILTPGELVVLLRQELA